MTAMTYVEFRSGRDLLRALADELVLSCAHSVAYDGPESRAVLALGTSLDPSRIDAMQHALRLSGGERRVLPPPELSADSWTPLLDAIAGMQLQPAPLAIGSRLAALTTGGHMFGRLRRLLGRFEVPFRLAHFGEETLVLFQLPERTGHFVAESAMEIPGIKLYNEIWESRATRAALYVEPGHKHPNAELLARVVSERAAGVWENFLCDSAGARRLAVSSGCLVQYSSMLRLSVAPDIRKLRASNAMPRERVRDMLSTIQQDRIEMSLRPSRSGPDRGSARQALEERASALRIEIAHRREQLMRIERELESAPRVYGLRQPTAKALRTFARLISTGTARRLICQGVRLGLPEEEWLFVMPRRANESVRVPLDDGDGWSSFVGQTESLRDAPVLFVPDTHRLVPPLAEVGAEPLLRALGLAGEQVADVRRVLVPSASADASWNLVELDTADAQPFLERLHLTAVDGWVRSGVEVETAFAPQLRVAELDLALSSYEEALTSSVVKGLERVTKSVTALRNRGQEMVKNLREREHTINELQKFQYSRDVREREVADLLAKLTEALEAFGGDHLRLKVQLEKALDAHEQWRRLAMTGETLAGSLDEGDA